MNRRRGYNINVTEYKCLIKIKLTVGKKSKNVFKNHSINKILLGTLCWERPSPFNRTRPNDAVKPVAPVLKFMINLRKIVVVILSQDSYFIT